MVNDMWLEWWNLEVGIKSRCTVYSIYKGCPNMESYITELQSKEIYIFVKFRSRFGNETFYAC